MEDPLEAWTSTESESIRLENEQESSKCRLRNKGVGVLGGCYLCDHEEESLEHLFFHCPFTINVIQVAILDVGIHFDNELDWISNISKLAESIRKDQLELILVAWFQVWSKRNNRWVRKKHTSYMEVGQQAASWFVTKVQDEQSAQMPRQNDDSEIRWQPPRKGI